MSREHRGERWLAYHHATAEEHARQWSERTAVGWSCISLSRSHTAAHPRFAAVWIWPEQRLPKQYPSYVGGESLHAQLSGEHGGWVPTIIAASGNGCEAPEFTVVYEESDIDCVAKAGLSHENLRDECKQRRDEGRVLRWATAYLNRDGEVRHAAIWVANPTRVAWKCTEAMTHDEFREEFAAHALGWSRPSVFVPTFARGSTTARRTISTWTDALVRASVCSFELDDDGLDDDIEKFKRDGLLPIQIQSLGVGAETRHAVIFGAPEDVIDTGSFLDPNPAPMPSPSTRYEGVSRRFQRHAESYSVSPDLTAAFDAAVEKDMRNTGRRAAALAVARDGDLVFAGATRSPNRGFIPRLARPTSSGSAVCRSSLPRLRSTSSTSESRSSRRRWSIYSPA